MKNNNNSIKKEYLVLLNKKVILTHENSDVPFGLEAKTLGEYLSIKDRYRTKTALAILASKPNMSNKDIENFDVNPRTVRYVREFIKLLKDRNMNYLSYLHLLEHSKFLKHSNCIFIPEHTQTNSIQKSVEYLKKYLNK